MERKRDNLRRRERRTKKKNKKKKQTQKKEEDKKISLSLRHQLRTFDQRGDFSLHMIQ
jgi:hypothetical protein